MEIIKKKINLDNYISRENSTWGQFTATTFNINVFFTQDGDDMGISTEIPFIARGHNTLPPSNTSLLVDYTKLLYKLSLSSSVFNFMTPGTTATIPKTGAYPSGRHPSDTLNTYFINGGIVSGLTDDRLSTVTSYDANTKYKPNLIINSAATTDYQNTPFDSGSQVVTNLNLAPITYLSDGDITPSAIAALPNISRGIYFTTTTAQTRTVKSEIFGKFNLPLTIMRYQSEGFNITNVHLSATTREEYLFGITSTPTVFNDIFIDRGRATVIQSHMQLSEVTNMRELTNYGNGFYKIR